MIKKRYLSKFLILTVMASLMSPLQSPINVHATNLENQKIINMNDILGNWYGNMYDIPIILTVLKDNTYSVVMGDKPEEEYGKWEFKDNIFIMDKNTDYKMEFTLEDETLKSDEFVLTRNSDDSHSKIKKETTKELSMSDFAGTWKATMIGNENIKLPISLLKDKMPEYEYDYGYLTINEDGTTCLDVAMGNEKTSIDSVTVKIENNELMFSVEKNEEQEIFNGLTATMLEDGTLCVKLSNKDVIDMDVSVFFERSHDKK